MKIAFDLRRIGNPGIGRYMKCLVEAVTAQAPEHEYLLILPPDANGTIECPGRRAEKICSSSRYYSVQEQVELPRLLRRHKADLLHSPHFNIPLARPCPTVVTIHDVIYLACKQDLPSRLGRLYYHAMMAASVRLAKRILTDSEFSRQDIIRYLHADPQKIEVVYPAVHPSFQRVSDPTRLEAVRSRYGLEEDYILYTGIYKPRKNHAGLLRAFREFLKSGEKAKLVIAGPLGEGEAELRKLGNELGIANTIIFTGYVPDSELPSLYSAARVYACPSLYEGFGFTVLEAMACGTPVVCSAATSLPEIAGDAAIYADARNPEQFAAALQRAFANGDIQRQLIEKGFANHKRFTWERAACRTVRAFELAAGFALEKAVCA
jgi:glycosyltransferase involved in cell wall biosynthesis